ncbi:MAG: hypothetical protein ACR2MN_03485 [Acidimicrobiales bacterium]
MRSVAVTGSAGSLAQGGGALDGPARRRGPGWGAGLVASLAIGAWPVVAIIRLVTQRNVLTAPWGDQALLETGARQALNLTRTLGPYSRYGWHHPGPALFYVMALPVGLFGSGPGLNVSMALINGAAAIATVVYLWRRFGGLAALWSAAAVCGLCLSLSMSAVLTPWNPDVLVLPLVAFVVLWADAIRGHLGALAWSAVVASFLVQSHISTGPFAVIMLASAAAGAVIVRRRSSPGRLRSSPVVAAAGLILFLASLVPSLIEVVRDRPNNLTLLYRFFVHGTFPRAPIGAALRQAVDALTVMPFGVATDPTGAYLPRRGLQLVLAAVVLVTVAAIGLLVARRREQPGAQWIILGSLLGGIVGLVASTRIDGAPLSYLVEWQAFVPCTLFIGLGCACFGGKGQAAITSTDHKRAAFERLRPVVTLVVGLCTLALVAVAVRNVITHPVTPGVNDPRVLALNTATTRAVPPGRERVTLNIVDSDAWPWAAAAALALQREGHPTAVIPTKTWAPLFGPLPASAAPGTVIAFYDATTTTPPAGTVQAQGGALAEFVPKSG